MTDQPDQGLSHVHGGSRIGDGTDVDAHQRARELRRDRLVGEELGRQPGLTQAGRNGSRIRQRSPHTDATRDPRPQRANEGFERFVRIKSRASAGIGPEGGPEAVHRPPQSGDPCRLFTTSVCPDGLLPLPHVKTSA